MLRNNKKIYFYITAFMLAISIVCMERIFSEHELEKLIKGKDDAIAIMNRPSVTQEPRAGKPIDKAENTPSSNPRPEKTIITNKTHGSTNPVEEISPSLRIVKKGDVLEMINNDNSDLKTLAEIKPYKDREGNFSGYVVDSIRWGSLPYLAGLRNGDIVKEVNNQRLLTPQKAIQVFKKTRKLNNIEISLLRNKREINLEYKIEQGR